MSSNNIQENNGINNNNQEETNMIEYSQEDLDKDIK